MTLATFARHYGWTWHQIMATPYGAFCALVERIGPAQAEEDLRRLNVSLAAQNGGDTAKQLAEELRERAYPESAWWNMKPPTADDWASLKSWSEGIQKRACRQRGGGP